MTPAKDDETETFRALTKGEKALNTASARKEKAAQTLSRLLEDDATADVAANVFRQMARGDRD